MKKITLFIALMTISLGFAQPTTNAPTPPARNATDVKSVYSDSYTNLTGTTLNPDWGQSGKAFVNTIFNPTGVTTNPNYVYFMDNLNYQGVEFTGQNLVSAGMEKLHIDIWTPNSSSFEVYLVSSLGGEKQVTLTPTLNGWNSYDIALTDYSSQNLPLTNIFQFKFVGNPFGTSKVYLDNIYFWKTPPPAGTPVIGDLNVPAKKVGDASFILTDPTSDSPGTFSYMSSNTAVATIIGKTVTIVSAGTTEITATQAASSPYISGSVKANLVVEGYPTSAAPTPPVRPASDVKSIYSEAYTPIAILGYTGDNNTYNTSWCGGITTEETIAGNKVHKVTGLGCEGVDFQLARFNATDYTHLHIDVWTASPTEDKSLTVKFSNWNGGAGEFNAILYTVSNSTTHKLPKPNPGTWISLDIPLADFFQGNGNGVIRNDLVQFILSSDLGTIFYDNIYFHKNTLSTQNFQAANIKMYPNPVINILNIEANDEIQKVTIYNVIGQEIFNSSPKSSSASIQTNSLQKGTYIITTEIDGKLSSSKFIKE